MKVGNTFLWKEWTILLDVLHEFLIISSAISHTTFLSEYESKFNQLILSNYLFL